MFMRKIYIFGFLLFGILLFFMVCSFTFSYSPDKPKVKTQSSKYTYLIQNLDSENTITRHKAVRKIFALGEKMKPFIAHLEKVLMSNSDIFVKVTILEFFSTQNYCSEQLLVFLNDESEDIRATAILVLKKNSQFQQKILKRIEDEDPFVRKVVLSVISEFAIPIEEKVQIWTDCLLHDYADEVRTVAAIELGHVLSSDIDLQRKMISALMHNIVNDPGETRYHAMVSLGNYHFSEVVEFIKEYLHFSDMYPYCIKALERLKTTE